MVTLSTFCSSLGQYHSILQVFLGDIFGCTMFLFSFMNRVLSLFPLKEHKQVVSHFVIFFFFLNSFDGYQSLIKSIGLAIINLQLYNWSCWPLEKLSFSLPYLWQAAKHINLSPPSSVDGQTSSPITLTVNSSGEAKIASLQCDIFFPVLFGKIMIKC